MVFADTTLGVLSGYTAVNQKQIYDQIATQLAAHSNWVFVESVDAVVSTDTYRTWVWRCTASGTGLPADFYVAFRARFVTSTGLWYTTQYLQIYVFEGYDSTSHTASKAAMTYNSLTAVTLAADGSNSTTWTLTAAAPATAPNQYAWVPLGNVTTAQSTLRMLCLVAKESIIVFQQSGFTGQVYIGAMETLLSATDDPMPVIIGVSLGPGPGMAGNQSISSTRHPKLSGSQTGVMSFSPAFGHTTSSQSNLSAACFLAAPGASNSPGALGSSTDTTYSMFLNTIFVSKCCISSSGTGSGSTRGGLRGFFKHMGAANTATHSFGDTFTVDGVAWASCGVSNNPMMDTGAA